MRPINNAVDELFQPRELAEDEYFSVNSITMSGNDGKEDASTLRISVVFRNEDGSLTEALYQIKPDCVDLIK